MFALTGSISGGAVTCTFNNLTFSNFVLQQYTDFSFQGASAYNFDPVSSPVGAGAYAQNAPNYLVAFSTSGPNTVITFSANTAPDVLGWTVNTTGTGTASRFGFEIKYNVTNTAAVNSVVATANTSGSVAGTAAAGNASSTFSLLKAATVGANTTSVDPVVNGSGGPGSSTMSIAIAPGSTGINVTEDPLALIANTSNASITPSTFVNVFVVVPEPVTFGLIGGGLIALAFLRKRVRSA
jgi:hypothetical protein